MTTLSAEGAPLASRALVVDSAAKAPFTVVLHLRSSARLFALANGPDADHNALLARISSDHGPFDASVSVGPALVLNPAVKSAGVGFVSDVVVELICAHTKSVAVSDTLAEMAQLPGAPWTVQVCAMPIAGTVEMISNAQAVRFILTGALL